MSKITPNNPPFPAYRATNKESFAYDTTVRRWPIILDSAITDIKQTIEDKDNTHDKEQGRQIIESIELLKKEIAEDKKLRPLQDNESDSETWNTTLQRDFPDATWFTGTWLFNECYLYRRLSEIFNLSTTWRGYDCFERQKNATFKGSYRTVFDLAQKMPGIINPPSVSNDNDGKLDEIIYHELIQVCLWGNATDLSLLTNMSEEDIQRLQAIEKDRLAERKQFILVDDTEKLWNKLKSLKHGRIDFVLDNSGFEVFVDLIFADWLLSTQRAQRVVFHCKTMPWFVSDVMPKDIPLIFNQCLDRDFFATQDEAQFGALSTLAKRWEQYRAEGRLVIASDDFWCSGLPYWYMKSNAPGLFEDMKQSDLVIYKGDLNFRKLVFDCDWPVTTPFRDAIGPDMANDFTNIITLRTNKADPCVGLTEQTRIEVEARATREEWRFSGKYAVVEYN